MRMDKDAMVVRCAACGSQNRVSAARVAGGQAAVCGRCKAALPVGGEVGVVSDATFAREVEGSGIPVVVDLWAPWCAPCRMIAPVVEGLGKEFAGRVRFVKLNIDENPATASRFRVDSIPTLLVMKGGREVDRLVGLQGAPEIRRRIAAVV